MPPARRDAGGPEEDNYLHLLVTGKFLGEGVVVTVLAG
jgi:hypothetical protein